MKAPLTYKYEQIGKDLWCLTFYYSRAFRHPEMAPKPHVAVKPHRGRR